MFIFRNHKCNQLLSEAWLIADVVKSAKKRVVRFLNFIRLPVLKNLLLLLPLSGFPCYSITISNIVNLQGTYVYHLKRL